MNSSVLPLPQRWFVRRIRCSALVAFLCFSAAFCRASAAAADRQPNFILILADDMGYSDLGCFGSEIQTPNLDRLAAQGMRFTQFYNNAKCTTSRASLLSGMYPRGKGNSIPRDILTAGEALRRRGYQTALMGKWHLGNKPPERPIDRGFDEFYGLMDGAVNYFDPSRPDPDYKGGKVRTFAHNGDLIHTFPKDFYTTDAFATHAIETIRQFSGTGKPFFLHLAFNSPHYPLQAWPADIAKYRGKYKQGWEELRRQRHARQLQTGLLDPKWQLSPTDSAAYPWETANQDWEDLRMATYAAMVDRMDQNIGKLLAALKELGLEENTVVMFLADNGGCSEEPGGRDPSQQPGLVSTYTAVGPSWGWAQNTPFRRYKAWVHEGGISTPFIVRWPGRIKPGASTNQVGHIIDVLPTCLELAGGDTAVESGGRKSAPLEGRSLLPIWKGGSRPQAAQLFWEWSGNCAVREGSWKIVWDKLNPGKRWELYDLADDRTELHDLAAREPARVQQLAAAYEKWAKANGRALPGSKSKKDEVD